MADKFGLSIIIGASLAKGFSGVLGKADKQFNTLRTTIRELSGQRKLISRFDADKAAVSQLSGKLGEAWKQVNYFRRQIEIGGQAAGKVFASDLEKAKRQANDLQIKLQKAETRLSDTSTKLKESGLSAERTAEDYVRLGTAIEKLENRQRRLGDAMAARDKNNRRRAELRSQLVDALAIGATIRAPIMAASQLQDVEVRLSTVINAKDVDKAIKQSREHAIKFARKNPISATDILNIEYALNSAGLDEAASRLGSETVAKVAKVTDGTAEQVGEVIATTFNNLGSQLEGNTADKLNRIGELLTKTQFKFQIRDFGQLGESMKYAAPTMAQYNIDLAQGVTLIGQLNSAGLQGSEAGTSLAATMRGMSKASQEFGFSLVRNKKGQFDFIATMEQMGASIGDFDNLSQDTIDKLQQTFGDEGVKGVILLGKHLKELRAAQEDVRKGSKGLVENSYAKFLPIASSQFAMMSHRVFELGAALGTILLPTINSVLGTIGPLVSEVADLTQRFPMATQVVVGLVGGLAAMKVASITLGYTWTFLKGGWLAGTVALRTMQSIMALANIQLATMNVRAMAAAASTRALAIGGSIQTFGLTLIGFARNAVPIAIGAMRALTIAFMTNPVGLIIGGIAIAAGLIYANWDKIGPWFAKLWSGITARLGNVWALAKRIFGWSPLGLLMKGWAIGFDWLASKFEWFGKIWKRIKSWFGIDKTAKGQGSGETGGNPASTAASPDMAAQDGPLTTAAQQVSITRTAPVSTTDSRQYTIHINQQPGEDADALARRVMELMRKQDAASARGALYDPAY